MRNDSVMFPCIPDNELQYPVKLSVEDILAIQNLYGSHDNGNRPAILATTAMPATTVASTTGVAPIDPSRANLCALRRLDAVLIMNGRLYISNRRNIWSVNVTKRHYGKPMTLTEYATFLPNNLVPMGPTLPPLIMVKLKPGLIAPVPYFAIHVSRRYKIRLPQGRCDSPLTGNCDTAVKWPKQQASKFRLN
ncbi:hypothetical protein ACFW04_012137 [Cataglyphis niger]